MNQPKSSSYSKTKRIPIYLTSTVLQLCETTLLYRVAKKPSKSAKAKERRQKRKNHSEVLQKTESCRDWSKKRTATRRVPPTTNESEREWEKERERKGEKVSTRDTFCRVWKIPGWSGATSPHPAEQAMTNIMIIPAAPSPSLVVLSLATSATLSLHFALPFQLPRSNPSFVLWQHQGARVANMGSHIWGCGRGFPVARGNRRRRYPDIDLGATRRVARLLSGRENVITALWWLR